MGSAVHSVSTPACKESLNFVGSDPSNTVLAPLQSSTNGEALSIKKEAYIEQQKLECLAKLLERREKCYSSQRPYQPRTK